MRSCLLAGAFALVGASAAHAADLIMDTAPVEPVATSITDGGVYVQLLGGLVQDLDTTFYQGGIAIGGSGTKYGYSVAGTVGVVVMDGLAVEADVLHTSRDFADADNGEFFTTTSLMGNLKYTVALNATFSVYGAAGLGYIWGTDQWPGVQQNYNGFGYQLIAGASAVLTDNITGLVEYRYQNQFDSTHNDPDNSLYGLAIPTSTILAGLKLSF